MSCDGPFHDLIYELVEATLYAVIEPHIFGKREGRGKWVNQDCDGEQFKSEIMLCLHTFYQIQGK